MPIGDNCHVAFSVMELALEMVLLSPSNTYNE
jgi:hypothetical protein